MNKFVLLLFLAAGFAAPAATNNLAPSRRSVTVADALDIAPVWAGHPVGFALLTRAPFQFVAFYDAERQLTVAQRRLDERKWTLSKLPNTTGWDSHNYVTLATDTEGFLHLSGDMHVSELKYFRSTKPWDSSTFERLQQMTGTQELRTTYPKFFRGADDALLFTYRDGSSGNGDQIFNVYDVKTKTWKRLLDIPLTNGEGQRNAYFHGPVKGPDGWFHLAWVWRETPDASSNHDLSYARSRDLIHWETGSGQPLELPMTLAKSDIVDPVPQKGGLINVNQEIGFDDQSRVTISYHKHDDAGNTQPWTARLENGIWRRYQTADWPYRWDFGGDGSLEVEITLGPVRLENDGWLTQTFRHAKFGSGTWLLDSKTLRATGKTSNERVPAELLKVEGKFPGLSARWAEDSGVNSQQDLNYILRWETLSANRDQPRQGDLPPPSMLRLIEIKTVTEAAR